MVSSQDLNRRERECWWDHPSGMSIDLQCLGQFQTLLCSWSGGTCHAGSDQEVWLLFVGVRNYFSTPLEKINLIPEESVWPGANGSPVKDFNLGILLTCVWVKSFTCQRFQPVQGDFKEGLLLAFMGWTEVKQITKPISF